MTIGFTIIIVVREEVYSLNRMTRVVIKASDVAAIIGQNKFKSRQEVFNDMWKKYSPENFTSKTKNDLAEEAVSKSETARSVIDLASGVIAKSSVEAESVFRSAEKLINSDSKLNLEEKVKVVEHLRSKVYTGHGIRKEDETARRCGLDLERDDVFHTMYIGTHNDRDYEVVGRVDRIEILPDGSKILVEIKNRTKGLFRRVYPSENVQIQVYLEMLDLDKAKLIEQYNSDVNVMEVQRDKAMFENEIFPGLENFCFELSNSLL
jgi:hypothetical protein